MAPVAIFFRRPQAARAALRRLVKLAHARDDDAALWHALGAALLALGDRRGALAAFRNAVLLDGGPAMQLALGNLLFDCGQCDPALRCFENVARMRPQD